eukprot:3783369-Heterocapsa_arctica.AAC.1
MPVVRCATAAATTAAATTTTTTATTATTTTTTSISTGLDHFSIEIVFAGPSRSQNRIRL